jgi:hypothetical protein
VPASLNVNGDRGEYVTRPKIVKQRQPIATSRIFVACVVLRAAPATATGLSATALTPDLT